MGKRKKGPKTTLTVLTPKVARKVPKPKKTAFTPDFSSRKGVRQRTNINIPGVKTV